MILDDNGTPIALCIEARPGHVRHFRAFAPGHLLTRAGDADFQEQLLAHGVLRTVSVKVIDPDKKKS